MHTTWTEIYLMQSVGRAYPRNSNFHPGMVSRGGSGGEDGDGGGEGGAHGSRQDFQLRFSR